MKHTLYLVLMSTVFTAAQCDFSIFMTIQFYDNPANTLADGTCCRENCTESCVFTTLRICFRQTQLSFNDAGSCFLTFNRASPTNFFAVLPPVTGIYVNSFQIFVRVSYDDDDEDPDFQPPFTDELIANMYAEVDNVPALPYEQRNGGSITQFTLKGDEENTSNVTLQLGFIVNCAESFNGSDCSTSCSNSVCIENTDLPSTYPPYFINRMTTSMEEPSVTSSAVTPTVASAITPSVASAVTPTVISSTVTPSVASAVTPTVTSFAITPSVTSFAVTPTVASAVTPSVTSSAVTPSVASAVTPSNSVVSAVTPSLTPLVSSSAVTPSTIITGGVITGSEGFRLGFIVLGAVATLIIVVLVVVTVSFICTLSSKKKTATRANNNNGNRHEDHQVTMDDLSSLTSNPQYDAFQPTNISFSSFQNDTLTTPQYATMQRPQPSTNPQSATIQPSSTPQEDNTLQQSDPRYASLHFANTPQYTAITAATQDYERIYAAVRNDQ